MVLIPARHPWRRKRTRKRLHSYLLSLPLPYLYLPPSSLPAHSFTCLACSRVYPQNQEVLSFNCLSRRGRGDLRLSLEVGEEKRCGGLLHPPHYPRLCPSVDAVQWWREGPDGEWFMPSLLLQLGLLLIKQACQSSLERIGGKTKRNRNPSLWREYFGPVNHLRSNHTVRKSPSARWEEKMTYRRTRSCEKSRSIKIRNELRLNRRAEKYSFSIVFHKFYQQSHN